MQQNDVNLWPPFSVTVTPLNNTQPCNINAGHRAAPDGFATGMLPVYYIPTAPQGPMQTQYSDPNLRPGFQGKKSFKFDQTNQEIISTALKILRVYFNKDFYFAL